MDPKQERDHKSSIVDAFQDNPRIIRDFSQLMDNQIDLLKDESTEGVNNAELAENIALQIRVIGSQNYLNLEQQSFQSLSQDNSPEIDDTKLSPHAEKRSRSVKNTVINSSFQKLQNMSFSWKSPSSSISHNLLNESQQMDNSPSKNIPNTVEFYHAYLAQLGENGPSEPQAVAPEDDVPEASTAARESLGYSVPRSSMPQDIPEPEEIDIDTIEQATMKAMKSISLKLETSSNASESRNSLVSERKDVNNNEKQDYGPQRISTLPDEREGMKEYNILFDGQIRNKRSNSARLLTNTSEVFLNISTLAAINDRKFLLRKSLQMRSVKLDSKPEFEEQRSNRFDKDAWEVPQKEEKTQMVSQEKETEELIDHKTEDVKSHMLENNKDSAKKYHLQNHYRNKGSYQKSQDSFTLEQVDLLKESDEKALKLAFPSMKSLTRADISCQFQSSNNFSFSIDDGHALDRSELVREITKHQFLDRIQAETSPIPMNQNQGMWDCSILEDQPTLEESYAQLMSSIKKLNARTFMMLRSAAKPSENIFVCCQAFVKLFAGLDNVIPSSYSNANDIQWVNIKALFSSPNKLIALASEFTRFVEQRKIPQKNIDGVIEKLSKIQFDPDEAPNDGFYQLYEFIVSAIEYNKLHRIHVKPQPRISTPVPLSQTQSQNQTPKTQPSPSKRTSVSPSKGSMKRVELNVSTNYNSTPVSTSQYKSPSTATRKSSPSQTPKVVKQQPQQEVKKPVEAKKPQAVKVPQEVKKKPMVPRSISNIRDNKRDQSMSNAKANKTVLSTSNSPARTRPGSTKMQSLNTSMQHYTEPILKGLDESTQIDQSQILEVEKMEKSFMSEAVVRKKESFNYRAQASRLLADHERYLKRKAREEEVKNEQVERKHDVDRRKRSVEYDKFQKNIERQFMKGLQAEKFRIEKEIKRKEEEKRNQTVKDDLDQSVINERFETSVILKRKQEKKVEISEHHKSFTHDNKVKREKEAKEQVIQKKEELKKRVETTVYNRKQIAQEADKWKDNYLLLEKLIGNAK